MTSSTPSPESELRFQIMDYLDNHDGDCNADITEGILGLVTAHLEAAVRSAKAEAYGDACYWATDKRMSKADIAEVCLTRRRVLLGEIEEPKSRFKLRRTPASESENSERVQQSNQGDNDNAGE